MDVKKFTQIIRDPNFFNYDKMSHKYKMDFQFALLDLAELYYNPLAINDFSGNKLVYMENFSDVNFESIKLMSYTDGSGSYGLQAAENEIAASNAIENINFSRDSIRNILKGLAPKDEVENRILGQKKGLEFIADRSNKITEENLYKLYQMTVGDFLDDEDKLINDNKYRHDAVYVVGDRIEHSGIDHRKLPAYMAQFITFINKIYEIDDFTKGAIIHFYIAYLHPYFDGNGRIARLVHLWYLIQNGFTAALFVPFSSLIERSKNQYYKAFTQIENNYRISGVIDVTPFIKYFIDNVYNLIPQSTPELDTFDKYREAVRAGKITDKEAELWKFVLSNYGTEEFSTKQLEKDFGNAAYATIRGFVLKFCELGLMSDRQMSNRVKYRVIG